MTMQEKLVEIYIDKTMTAMMALIKWLDSIENGSPAVTRRLEIIAEQAVEEARHAALEILIAPDKEGER